MEQCKLSVFHLSMYFDPMMISTNCASIWSHSKLMTMVPLTASASRTKYATVECWILSRKNVNSFSVNEWSWSIRICRIRVDLPDSEAPRNRTWKYKPLILAISWITNGTASDGGLPYKCSWYEESVLHYFCTRRPRWDCSQLLTRFCQFLSPGILSNIEQVC